MTNRLEDFRKAELIELHDRHVAIHPEHYSDALAGWSEYAPRTNFVINGKGLDRLATYFGIEQRPLKYKESDSDRTGSMNLKHDEIIVLSQEYDDVGSGYMRNDPDTQSHKIKELWAKVVSPNLLEIRFVTLFDGDGEPDSEEIQTITYSGSFSVWWSQVDSD